MSYRIRKVSSKFEVLQQQFEIVITKKKKRGVFPNICVISGVTEDTDKPAFIDNLKASDLLGNTTKVPTNS
jgi:hypothetical protein